MMAPWFIKNAVLLDNPLSPFANGLFPNPFAHVSFERDLSAKMLHFNGVTFRELPRELFVSGERPQGLLGPVFFLSLLGIAALSRPRGRQLLLAAAVFSVGPMISPQTRYFIPVLPFLALALAMVLGRFPAIGVAVLALHAVLSWPSVVERYCSPNAWRIHDLPWRTALRLESEQQYLTREVGDLYEITAQINRHVAAGQNIFAWGGVARSWLNSNVVVSWESAFGERMSGALNAAMSEGLLRSEYRFPTRSVRKVRIVPQKSSDADRWGANEVRFFHGDRELSRLPNWRLSARPNVWDVPLAFDNNPATGWSTWEPYKPGMHIEVDFGQATELDQVVVETSLDQPRTELRIQCWTGSRWDDVETTLNTTTVALPDGRRAAAAYLKANGLQWLLSHRDDAAAKDLALHYRMWGITLSAANPSYRLYRID